MILHHCMYIYGFFIIY